MRPAVALAESLRPAVRDERVLAAIASIPRELFVPVGQREQAYDNNALPIACGQTISQPLVVARMLEVLELRPDDRALDVGTGSGYHAALLSLLVAEVWTIERHEQLSAQAAEMLEVLELRPDDRALDVGTGSGYHAALLSLLVAEVWTIERHEQLSAQAAEAIDRLELDNISFAVGDGWLGMPSEAPFDVINVAAATGQEQPTELERQLARGGRMVAPVGGENQYLTLTRRTPQGLIREQFEGVRFVPLIRDDSR